MENDGLPKGFELWRGITGGVHLKGPPSVTLTGGDGKTAKKQFNAKMYINIAARQRAHINPGDQVLLGYDRARNRIAIKKAHMTHQGQRVQKQGKRGTMIHCKRMLRWAGVDLGRLHGNVVRIPLEWDEATQTLVGEIPQALLKDNEREE